MNNRRGFIKSGGLALFALSMGGIPHFVKAAVVQQKATSHKKVLVCIFQRGAMDGLMAVTPYRDTHLKKSRPNIFMEPGAGKSFIDLDGKFGLTS